MRILKFRAWNKLGKEMIPPMDIQNMIHQKVSTIPLKMLYDDLEFQQFTWLLWHNSEEVYEWDICKFAWTIWVFKWDDMQWKVFNKEWKWMPLITLCTPEVIWNIYSNPELLK